MNRLSKLLFIPLTICLGIMLTSCSRYQNQELRIGIASDRSPWELKNSANEGSGISVDLINEFSKSTNRNVTLVWLDSNNLFDALDQSKVDCIFSSQPIDSSKLNDYLVSDPYTKVFDIIMFRPNSVVKSKKDLNHENIKIAVVTDTYHEKLARSNFSNAQIIGFPNFNSAVASLSKGTSDVYIDDAFTIVYAYAENTSDFSINPAPLNDDFQYYAVYAKTDNEVLIQNWNKFFSQSRVNGTMEQIENKYLTPIQDIMNDYNLPLSL